MRFSMIIPVYNAEKYLANCLDSILKQNSMDCEILLINDGSQDGSEALCRQYAAEYACVCYTSQANAGPSAARNTGIRMAKGEYLLFLDADDELKPGSMANIDRIISEKAPDAIVSGLILRDIRSGKDSPEAAGIDCRHFESGADGALKELGEKRFSTPASKVIVKRQVVAEHNIFFPTEFWIGEDICMMSQALCECKKIVYNAEPYYIYNQNDLSITHTVNYQRISKTMDLCEGLYLYAETLTQEKRFFLYTQMSMMLINFLRYYLSFASGQRRQVRSWMRGNRALLTSIASVHPTTRLAGKVVGSGCAFILAAMAVRFRK